MKPIDTTLRAQMVFRLEDLGRGDPESAHGTADDILVEALRAAGYDDIADAYDAARLRVGFWYA